MKQHGSDFWLNRLPGSVLAAAGSSFFAGFFAHLFAFTNLIPNPDGISRIFDEQQMTVSGRWFLHYATAWNGYIQAPALIGFFALLFLSLASGLTVSLLRIRRVGIGALCGALMSVFPSVAYTFLYMFTASAYCFGILLAVLSVWLVSRYKYGFLFAAPVLACAVGTYQAYLAVAASLALIRVLLDALESGRSAGEIIRQGLRYLLFLLLSLGLYALILWIFLQVKDLKLLDYRGISTFGGKGLRELLSEIGETYKIFLRYYFVPHRFANYTTPAAVAGNAVLILTALWALLCLIYRNGCFRRFGVLGLTALLCLLLPLALNLTSLMGFAMPIMRYALVLTYVLALALVDRAASPVSEARAKKAAKKAEPKQEPLADRLTRWIAACAAAFLLMLSFQIDNLAYTVSLQAHRATESFVTRLVERVETLPGYQNGMQVVIIGGFPSSIYYNNIEAYSLVQDYSDSSTSVIPLNKHVYYYLNDWMNVPWKDPGEALLQAVSDSEQFQSMPLYPDDGSVVISDGMVIVKLAGKYKPKQAYEIAYENRR